MILKALWELLTFLFLGNLVQFEYEHFNLQCALSARTATHGFGITFDFLRIVIYLSSKCFSKYEVFKLANKIINIKDIYNNTVSISHWCTKVRDKTEDIYQPIAKIYVFVNNWQLIWASIDVKVTIHAFTFGDENHWLTIRLEMKENHLPWPIYSAINLDKSCSVSM